MQLSLAQNNYMYHHNEDMDDYNDGNDVELLRSKYKQGNTRVYHDFFKTKMCNLYLLNICKKGEDCPFAHSEDEIREKPNLHKTKLCPYFLEEGKCVKGNYCSFAHGEEELRSTPDLFKTAICNLWTQGKCSSGERCRFAHGQEDLRPAPSHHKAKKNKYNKTFHNGSSPAPRHNQNNQRYNNNNHHHHQNNNHNNFAYPVQPNFMPNSFAYPMYQGAEMPESFEDSDIMGAFADGNNKMHFGTFKY